jgi:V-type H+-transporting ATPase subunit C
LLGERVSYLTQTLYKKALYAFSELYIALLHLKVMRAFIDGVLRFGIPARFAISIVHPQKGQEKAILNHLNQKFNDQTLAGLYGTAGGGKEEAGDDDFFSFVSIPLTSPSFLM